MGLNYYLINAACLLDSLIQMAAEEWLVKGSMVAKACKLLFAVIHGGCSLAERSGNCLCEALQKGPAFRRPGRREGRGRGSRWREGRLAGGCRGTSLDNSVRVTDQPMASPRALYYSLSRPHISFSFLFLLKTCDDNYRESFERRKPSYESFVLAMCSHHLMDTYLRLTAAIPLPIFFSPNIL